MLKPPVVTEACLMPRSELGMFNSCMVKTFPGVIIESVDSYRVAEVKGSDIHGIPELLVAKPAELYPLTF
jgi:hypothetical protein